MKVEKKKKTGVMGYFDSPTDLLKAAEKVRDARYRDFDVYSPFPVHGMDDAMGLKRSPLPYVTFVAGLTGFISAFALQYWTSAVDWPLNVGGKPFNSWPAFVPVMFELTVLFAGLATVGAMFALNGLPNTKKKAYDPRLTSDRFAIVIEDTLTDWNEEDDRKKMDGFKKYEESEVSSFLQGIGAKEIRRVEEEGWF